MSVTSKITFGLACLTSVGIIGYVHVKQHIDRERLHEGVLLDVQMQQRRKTENLYLLQQQAELTKQLRRSQEGT